MGGCVVLHIGAEAAKPLSVQNISLTALIRLSCAASMAALTRKLKGNMHFLRMQRYTLYAQLSKEQALDLQPYVKIVRKATLYLLCSITEEQLVLYDIAGVLHQAA